MTQEERDNRGGLEHCGKRGTEGTKPSGLGKWLERDLSLPGLGRAGSPDKEPFPRQGHVGSATSSLPGPGQRPLWGRGSAGSPRCRGHGARAEPGPGLSAPNPWHSHVCPLQEPLEVRPDGNGMG